MSSSHQPEGEILPSGDPPGAYIAEDIPAPRRRTRSILSAPGTYVLVGINCAVFLWMILHGVDPASPTPAQLIHFGANVPALVLHGQWYRLLSATFVHVGLIHLLTNMWCLWNLGLLGEPLLGPWGMIAVYMLTGVAGNLLSLLVNILMRDFVSVGAGASGAVFGIAGILIVLLSNRKLPIPTLRTPSPAPLRDPVCGTQSGDRAGDDCAAADPHRQLGARWQAFSPASRWASRLFRG